MTVPITKTTQWQQATEAVQAAQTILVVTHVSPDGDAIGSLLGLSSALLEMGKAVDYAVDDGGLEFLKFLPGSERIQGKLHRGQWDLMISVDASDEERTGHVGAYGREHSPVVINLDHHATNTLFGDIHLVDSTAVSATQVIYAWLTTMDFPISSSVATSLLTGLVTDTIGFRTSNVTADTLQVAQELMQRGASLTEITERALDTNSFQTITLWKYALNSVELHEGGIIIAVITQDDLRRSGLQDATDAGLVQFLIRVEEAMIAAVLKESTDGEIKLSLRSKPGYDVASVAFEMGGGGHKQASGATIPGPMQDAKSRVLVHLKQAVRQGKLAIV